PKVVQLTLIDKQILESYRSLVEGLGNYLGFGYEIVLHSLEDFKHSVVYIKNGEHTGRTVGAPITDKALELLVYFYETNTTQETYYSFNSKGEPLKSTTIAIQGENNRIIGLLCMNFYMNITFYDFIHEFIQNKDSAKENKPITETFASNVDDMIYTTLNSVKKEIYNNPNISSSNKNKEIIFALNNRGIFQIKDSVSVVAKLLNISKNTVYLHLRNCEDDSTK
ncbi:helix-turn-helix transcriptional regulator, partial [Amedibacillus dolichus]